VAARPAAAWFASVAKRIPKMIGTGRVTLRDQRPVRTPS
jgi:hypothetical protein